MKPKRLRGLLIVWHLDGCRFVDLYDSFIAERLFKSSILRSLFVIIPQILQGIYCHSKSTNEDDKVHRS